VLFPPLGGAPGDVPTSEVASVSGTLSGAGHPCAVGSCMGRYGHRPGGVNQALGCAGGPGAMTIHDLAPGGARSSSSRSGEGGDLSVLQAVVD
jgi:hypothetical protein